VNSESDRSQIKTDIVLANKGKLHTFNARFVAHSSVLLSARVLLQFHSTAPFLPRACPPGQQSRLRMLLLPLLLLMQ
jgi:hypothetical protein